VKKRAVAIALSATLLAFILLRRSSGFVEFQPLRLNEGTRNELVPAPELVTPQYAERLKDVLDFYHESYKTNATGRLLIKRKLAWDRELIWNYTKKALDDDFMSKIRSSSKGS